MSNTNSEEERTPMKERQGGISLPPRLETAQRQVTFWRNGFSFGDGPLLLYDDPQSAAILEAIHSGTVPPALLGIKAGQLVALAVAKRTQEDYVEAGGSDGRRPSTPPTGE